MPVLKMVHDSFTSALNNGGLLLIPKGPCSYMVSRLGPKYIPYTYMDLLEIGAFCCLARIEIPSQAENFTLLTQEVPRNVSSKMLNR